MPQICTDQFSELKSVFEENISSGKELGAGLAVYLDGELVVNLWGGLFDKDDKTPWQEDTIVNVFSTTKAITASCAIQLNLAGELDFDKPVAYYWPEFAQEGKQDIPVRWLLTHQAGLSGLREMVPNEALYDWDFMCGKFAAETPWWEPGKHHGYHAISYGWLVGEVIRRVAGITTGQYFKQQFAEPLGLDFHIGLNEEDLARVTYLRGAKPDPSDPDALAFMQAIMGDPTGVTARAFANPMSVMSDTNTKEWRTSEMPAANGHSDAKSLARFYAMLAAEGQFEGKSYFESSPLSLMAEETVNGEDQVLPVATRFSHGFMLPQDRREARMGKPGSFGHPGAGGSFGFADPANKLAFGYVMNRMGPAILLDKRVQDLLEALYRDLGQDLTQQ